MKSYTDLDQAKKLSEILPLESADMWLQYIGTSYNKGVEKPIYFPMVIRDSETDKDIPCWSLAALLNILPILDDRNANFCKDIRHDKWHVFYHSTTTSSMIDTERYDNLIDAVFEMILKLHELNLL